MTETSHPLQESSAQARDEVSLKVAPLLKASNSSAATMKVDDGCAADACEARGKHARETFA